MGTRKPENSARRRDRFLCRFSASVLGHLEEPVLLQGSWRRPVVFFFRKAFGLCALAGCSSYNACNTGAQSRNAVYVRPYFPLTLWRTQLTRYHGAHARACCTPAGARELSCLSSSETVFLLRASKPLSGTGHCETRRAKAKRDLSCTKEAKRRVSVG